MFLACIRFFLASSGIPLPSPPPCHASMLGWLSPRCISPHHQPPLRREQRHPSCACPPWLFRPRRVGKCARRSKTSPAPSAPRLSGGNVQGLNLCQIRWRWPFTPSDVSSPRRGNCTHSCHVCLLPARMLAAGEQPGATRGAWCASRSALCGHGRRRRRVICGLRCVASRAVSGWSSSGYAVSFFHLH